MIIRSILCPVDFSAQSRQAVRCAMAMALRFDADLTVLFVNDPLLLAAGSASHRGQRRFVDRTRAELGRFVKQSVRPGRGRKARIALVTSVGNPADEILHQARRLRCDLLVMGSHGLSGFHKLFFGSTTEQVLRKATVPVLAIPPGTRGTAPLVIDTSHVVAPIDLAGDWQPDAVRAADVAGEFGATLLLVHVLEKVQTPPWLPPTASSTNRRRIDKTKAALEHVRTKLFSDLRSMSTAVAIGNPAHEIERLTRRRGTLVVMSLRGTAGVWGVRRGSIAYRVLTHAATPVLALPRQRIGGSFSARARKALSDVLTARDRAEIAGIDALLSVAAGRRRITR